MKKNFVSILASVMLSGLFSVFAVAQDNRQPVPVTSDLYLISAKAGGINYVEGNVTVAGKNKRSGRVLKGDMLNIGDRISTGADGRAEILLNPGSYVRLAENSSFEFATTSLDDLQLKLSSGSAMFEIITADEFEVVVNVPKARLTINTSGVYRVDVLNDGSGKISVWKGKVRVGGDEAIELKSGRAATVSGNQVAAVTKFDRDEKDALETWSKSRAKELAQVNSSLQRTDLRNSLLSSYGASRWNMYNSFGLWVFDSFRGGYCFLPFGYGWGSPYGYGYGRDLWYFRLPRVIITQPPASGGGTTMAGKSRVRQTNNPTMPYERIQQKTERARVFPNANDDSFTNPPPSAAPSARPASKAQRANQ